MARLHELRRERAALATTKSGLVTALREARAAYRVMLEASDPGEDMPPEAKPMEERVTECENALDDHQKSIDDHDSRINDLERVQDDDAERSIEVGRVGRSHNSNAYGFNEPAPREGKGFKAARFAMGVLVARGAGMSGAADYVERRFYDKEVAKALNTTGVATGGALIPQAFSNEIIELLRAATVIRDSEPTIIDMPMGNLTIPRMAAGATAGYQGELDDMASSQETFDDLQLNAKKLTALVPVSNDMIRRAPSNIEMIVRDDMVQSLARREDLAFMLGDGSGNSPIGLLNLCGSSNKLIIPPFSASDNATIQNAVNAALNSLVLALKQNFSRMIRPVWIMSAVTEAFLKGLLNPFGNYIYQEEMTVRGTLNGIRYKVTQQIPTNISANLFGGGTANDGAYLFLADFADVILAETYSMSVDASDVAAYKDSGGNLVSTFTRDQTAFRIIEEHDLNIRHQASVAVALLPAWAPAGFASWTGGAAYYVQAPSGDMSAAPSTWGIGSPTGSNNPGNSSAVAPGGTQPGRP